MAPGNEQQKDPKRTVVVNAAKLDPKNPIPIETNGQGYTTRLGRAYAPFLDRNDNFFQVLLEANALSPTNLACVNSKTKFSIGKGLSILDKETSDPDFEAWVKSVNKRGHSLNDVIKNGFNNKFVAGNCFIEAVRFSVGGKKYFHVYKRNFLDCRLVLDEETDLPVNVIVSKKFRRKGMWNVTEDDAVTIPIYNGDPKQKWFKDSKGVEHIMFHLKSEASGYDQYGMPSNVACLPEQILEYKMARYNMDNFDNNLVIGGLIVLQGNFTPEESKHVAREITTAHTGDGKRGKYVILASETGIDNSKVINFDQNKEYDYINGDKRVEEKIFLSNEWSKVLIDPQTGSLGNSGKQIREIYETKMNTVIAPEQAEMLQKFVVPLIGLASEWLGKKWNTYTFGFSSIPILGISSEIDVNAILTVDEGRAALGYPAHPDSATGLSRIKTAAANSAQQATG